MSRTWFTCALLLVVPAVVSAQAPSEPLTEVQTALACAPPARLAGAGSALRIAGSSDTLPRNMFGTSDQVIVAAGTGSGLAVGQRYYIRRDIAQTADTTEPGMFMAAGHLTHTVGWLRIVASDTTTSVAVIEHACGVAEIGDYLEAFAVPVVPAALTSPDTLGDLDFSKPARVLFGDQQQVSAGVGDFVLVDRGSAGGVTTGSRFGIYRDIKQADVPLASVGEAVVVSAAPDVAVVRIVRARDAVFSGDYVVPEKK